MPRTRLLGAVGALALIGGLGTQTAAVAAEAPGTTPVPVASGFKGPLNISVTNSYLYVADAFGGQLVRVSLRTGTKRVLAQGSFGGVGVLGSQVYATVTREPEAGLPQGAAQLARISGGQIRPVADLLAHELKHNPDGQAQQTGKDADALTNPYAVLALPGRRIIADAGANDVLEVSATGAVRTIAAIPNITVGKCAGMKNNDPQHLGCDSVPTGVAMGPDKQLYVSGLGAEVAGRIWRLDPQTGKIGFVYGNLPPLTGIAIDADGNIYASSLFTNSIFRITPGGVRAMATVPGPTGLAWRNGVLYAASQTGNVFSVPAGAFK